MKGLGGGTVQGKQERCDETSLRVREKAHTSNTRNIKSNENSFHELIIKYANNGKRCSRKGGTENKISREKK